MSFLHFDLHSHQSSRVTGQVSGDCFELRRYEHYSVVAFSDGLGHGVRAHLAATMCISRLLTLMENGRAMHESFRSVVNTMNQNRGNGGPYAAFMLIRIAGDGETTILNYEMPAPVLVSMHRATPVRGRSYSRGGALLSESHCFLREGETLCLFSDGVSQAGMGKGLVYGWGEEGISEYIRERLPMQLRREKLCRDIHDEARRLWCDVRGDDVTVLALEASPGRAAALMTGPPLQRASDERFVREFFSTEGFKVICGASTAAMVGRQTGVSLSVQQDEMSLISPPRYFLRGVDLVTEGAVTLNQLYNIFSEPNSRLEPETGVTLLHRVLHDAHRITLFVGDAPSLSGDDIQFTQQGILPRHTIITLLRTLLEEAGKLVLLKSA